MLLPPKTSESGALSAFVTENGAAVLNTAFSGAVKLLADCRARQGRPLRLTLVGLGDVGGTVLTGLNLLAKA